jgi:hypothetical protein
MRTLWPYSGFVLSVGGFERSFCSWTPPSVCVPATQATNSASPTICTLHYCSYIPIWSLATRCCSTSSMSFCHDYHDSWGPEDSKRLLNLRNKHAELTWDEFTSVSNIFRVSFPPHTLGTLMSTGGDAATL